VAALLTPQRGPLDIYLVLKSRVLPRVAGSKMGQACPALRGSEFSGSA